MRPSSILVLLLVLVLTFPNAEGTPIIVGTAINAFCPLRGEKLVFEVPSEEPQNLDIRGNHLHIPEARLEHSGSINCSDGRKSVFVKHLHVVRK